LKTIIAGSRDITDYSLIQEAVVESRFDITQIVSGGARGVDKLGEQYAKNNNIDCIIFPANWTQDGKAAGPIRNKKMGDYANALIAIWDGESRGTGHMISYAKSKGLKVYIYYSRGGS